MGYSEERARIGERRVVWGSEGWCLIGSLGLETQARAALHGTQLALRRALAWYVVLAAALSCMAI